MSVSAALLHQSEVNVTFIDALTPEDVGGTLLLSYKHIKTFGESDLYRRTACDKLCTRWYITKSGPHPDMIMVTHQKESGSEKFCICGRKEVRLQRRTALDRGERQVSEGARRLRRRR